MFYILNEYLLVLNIKNNLLLFKYFLSVVRLFFCFGVFELFKLDVFIVLINLFLWYVFLNVGIFVIKLLCVCYILLRLYLGVIVVFCLLSKFIICKYSDVGIGKILVIVCVCFFDCG